MKYAFVIALALITSVANAATFSVAKNSSIPGVVTVNTFTNCTETLNISPFEAVLEAVCPAGPHSDAVDLAPPFNIQTPWSFVVYYADPPFGMDRGTLLTISGTGCSVFYHIDEEPMKMTYLDCRPRLQHSR